MNYYPLFTRLQDVPCLVVGGGDVAERKIRQLRRAGADITVNALTLNAELQNLNDEQALKYVEGPFDADLVRSSYLVFAATDDKALNRKIAAVAQTHKCFCNVVDDRELSSAIVPAVVDRSPITVAISSGGLSPVLATRLRLQLEQTLPTGLGRLADLLGEWRNEVAVTLPDLGERRQFWQTLLDGPLSSLTDARQQEAAHDLIRQSLQGHTPESGIAFITGAGPGDPELLTLKAVRALASADVVIHDRLVSRPILDFARKDAEIISVGKTGGSRSIPQSDINAILVHHVQAGKRVCRLKGGDPFVFGRGGEEIDALNAAGLRWQVIPGISAANGIAAANAIPLTHRSLARQLVIATASTAGDEPLDWAALARAGQTLVLYMAGHKLEEVSQQLIAAGCEPERPAILIENGTLDTERRVSASIVDIPQRASEAGIGAPSLLIVGAVVNRATAPQNSPQRTQRSTSEWLDAAASGDAMKPNNAS